MKQSVMKETKPSLKLIPPLSEEFSVYGNKDVVERARAWALKYHYVLAKGVPICAHGFYMMDMCPGVGVCHRFEQLDHVNMWVNVSENGARPFLLSHPYSKEVDAPTKFYASAHGLVIDSHEDDGWYGQGTIPIRMELASGWPVWPIEAAVHTLLVTQPLEWPKNE